MQKVVAIGAALGFVGAVGIYFAPEEPYPGYITLAGTLSGVTIALLITIVVTRDSSLGQCLGWAPPWACWIRPQSSWPRARGQVGMLPSWC